MAAAAAATLSPFHSSHSHSPQEQQQQQTPPEFSLPTPPLSKKPKSLLHKHPLYTPPPSTLSLQFKEKILCLELIGIDSGKALALNPNIHSTPLTSINTIITFLQSKGIQIKDLQRIIGMCPKILTSSIQNDLIPVFNFLTHDLQVPDRNFRKVINKCPRLLVSSAENQLKPALFYLQRLGFRDLEALAYRDCVLLVSNVENTLMPKLDYLVNLGFTKSEVIEMVLRCPGLFTFSIENNFRPKFEYFEMEMKGDLGELKKFPQYFAFSLEKRIKPRHMEAMESGVEVPLSLLLKSTDEEFAEMLRQGKRLNSL